MFIRVYLVLFAFTKRFITKRNLVAHIAEVRCKLVNNTFCLLLFMRLDLFFCDRCFYVLQENSTHFFAEVLKVSLYCVVSFLVRPHKNEEAVIIAIRSG